MAGGRRAPPHNQRGNDTEREAVGADHRAERGQRDRADHQATRVAKADALCSEIIEALQAVESLDADRVLRRLAALIADVR